MILDITIVIINYKTYNLTIQCIDSIIKNVLEKYHIIIVDNNSKNKSLQKIYQHFCMITKCTFVPSNESISIDSKVQDKSILLIQANANLGYAKGNNIGIELFKQLNSKYLLVLNNDVIFINDPFGPLMDNLNYSEETMVAGPKIIKPSGNIDINCAKNSPSFADFLVNSPLGHKIFNKKFREKHFLLLKKVPTHPINVDLISGSFMLFKKELFNYIDGYDPNTFLYYEENIMYEKLKSYGFKTVFVPSAVVIHYHGASTGLSSRLFRQKESFKSMRYYLKEYKQYSLIKLFSIKLIYKFPMILLKLKKLYESSFFGIKP